MSKSTNKALIYTKISSRSSDSVAFKRQADELKKLAAADGYTDITVIETTTPSGKPQYDSLIKEIETGQYGAVYVYEISKVSRRAEELRKFFAKADEANVDLKITTLPQLPEPSIARSIMLDFLAQLIERDHLDGSARARAVRGAYRGKEVGA